jgi:AraC-like DNA-binding protein
VPTDVNDFHVMKDGKVLVGSLSGLFVYDPKSGFCSKMDTGHDGRGLRILCLYEDAGGVLWIGAKEGLRCYSYGESPELKELKRGIPPHIVQVQCLYQSRSGRVWIGTADGLYFYDQNDGRFAMLADVPGLTQITIKGVEEDSRGNLWISTDNGLTRYDPVTGENRTYYVRDGLLSNQFNAYSSHCSDIYGNLYFGGLGGVTYFDPTNVSDNQDAFPPIITGLKLFNVEVKSSDATGILKTHITLADSIELRHDQNSITLSFACTDYASGGRNRFRYKMEGIDKDWIDADTRTVTYNNIDKGSYCFQLEASNSDGVWSPQRAQLHIKVDPVWYRTVVAKVFGIMLLMLVVGWLLYRIGKYQEKQAAEKIGALERKHEEDVRRARMAAYVLDPYLLKASDEVFVEKTLNYIDENLVNPQFSVEKLASLMGMTRANLHLKIKAFTGMSPVELIRKMRIETACRLIREGSHTMTEISERTGFNSATYFATSFKKVVGSTPGEYAASLASDSKF